MPTSDYRQISDVLHVVQQFSPRSVLDVGVGFGKWGILCREVLELYENRLTQDSWAIRIDGIEVHEQYRNPVWTFAYNHVHIGNALTIVDIVGHYDLIICCDVIEHLDKDDGRKLLNKFLSHGTFVIVQTRLLF